MIQRFLCISIGHEVPFHGGIGESLVRITTAFVVPVRSSLAITRFTAILRCLVYCFGQQLVELIVRWLATECKQ